MKYEFHILALRNEEIFSLFIYAPIIVKINMVHSVFVGIHEQEISASSSTLSIN